MKCQFCHQHFPDRFYLPFFTNDGSFQVDPACAKKEIERIHGVKDYEFSGEVAKDTYEEFVEWKQAHPRDGHGEGG